jgi:hypothetical protein
VIWAILDQHLIEIAVKFKVHAKDLKAFTSMFTLDVSSMYHHYKPHDVYPVQIAKHKTAEAI